MIAVLTLLAFLAFAWKRLLTYLHIFQQEEYDGPRFLRWLVTTGSVDKRLSGFAAALGVFALLVPSLGGAALLALAAAFAAAFWIEKDPRQTAKKRLVLTKRARRILISAAVLTVLAGLVTAIVATNPLVWLIPIHLIPVLIVAGNLMLAPMEARVQKKFWQEAHDKVLRLETTVIGITGSYGKTSVKHILGHVLQSYAPTLITPGSVNTVMGIARIVRERLSPHHKFLIAEMGAYGPGSIKRLCDLTPPHIGIVTAVGPAHYERFKTLDQVAIAKSELPDAALKNGGMAIINADLRGYGPFEALHAQYPGKVLLCGKDGDLVMGDVRQTPEGLAVEVQWQGQSYTLEAPLFGTHHGFNVAISFAMACHLGMVPEDVILMLKTVPQITHRLEVKSLPNGARLIDDAYNSNPKGFKAALEMLSVLCKEPGRRIVVTPGMVELGTAHDEEHAKIGKVAANHADIVIAVAPERIESFVTAYKSASNGSGDLLRMENFAQAQTWLDANAKPDDVILLENDLPDLYERRLAI